MKQITLIIFSIIFFPSLLFAQATSSNDSFWADGYEARWVSQTQASFFEGAENDGDEYFDVEPEDVVNVEAVFENTGKNIWYNSPSDRQISIAIYKDPKVISAPVSENFDRKGQADFGKSYFYDLSWESSYRITTVNEDDVKTGFLGTFKMVFQIPLDCPAGRYREDITLASGPYWMKNNFNGDPIGAAHIWVGFDVHGEVDEKVAYMFDLVNQDRASQGMEPLALDPFLSTIALAHSRDQAENLHNISHTGSDGASLKDRIDRGGFTGFWSWGENVEVLWGYTGSNWQELIKKGEGLFFNEKPPQDGHRKNILSENFTHIGIGVYDYNGKLWITQDFMAR